jgi:fumarate reductase subunit C
MSGSPAYTPYHPRWIRQRVSTYWWLQRWSYFVFILRELSSVFVAWFVAYLLLLVRAIDQGAASYREFLEWSAGAPVLGLNVVSLVFVVFHAITWFNLAPQAMVVHVGGRRVADAWVSASNYAAWAIVSAVVVWLVAGAG